MPDESCRLCGGSLAIRSQCGKCRKTTQKICQTCNAITREQFHDTCNRQEPVLNMRNGCVLEAVQKKTYVKRSYPVRSIAISVGIIGFFMLGFTTAAYLDIFQSQPPSAEMVNPDNIQMPQVRYDSTVHDSLQNCLAYGSGESVTVTCPTQYGYAYKAILNMPGDLADKFSDSVFSIRGVSVTENPNGAVILQYQNNLYLTSFFAS
ncbi:MAG: hypothetical protein KGI27_06290 [Thaumarchaeota archaeon]|nr:hypothetical protein [Nitrososphaerota archaeon]